jgi:tetratricopeptide (TPR) repeat protein
MLYAYEKLDLKRLRQTKIGPYRLKMSKAAIGPTATNQWLGIILLTGGLLGLSGVGYYFFPNISTIQNKFNRDKVTKIQLPSNSSKPNLLPTSATKTLSPSNLSSTKTVLAINSVKTTENQSVVADIHHSIKPSLKSIPVQSQEMPLLKESTPELTQLLQQCEKYLQANYLTTGKAGNAFDCYQQVLAQVPNQVEAKSGLQQIEIRYQHWIMAALRQEQYAKVRHYWEKLRLVNPQSTLLAQIETELQQKITFALSAKQLTQANHYLANLAKLKPNSSVLPTLKSDLASAIAIWLQQCEQHFQANRLTLGKSGNALECYQQLLIQDPHNSQAKAGLIRIEKRYQQWTEQALQQQKLSTARQYLKRLQLINPKSSQLSQLQQQLVKLEQPPLSSKSPVSVSSDSFNSSPSLPALPVTAGKPAVQPTHSRFSPPSSKQCSDIFMQESLGIRPLTQKQKEFKLQYCNK